MRILKIFGKVLLLVITLLVALMYINPSVKDSHTEEAYINLQEEREGMAPEEKAIIQRIILFGDAGHATIEPWQASMVKVTERATISPEKTAVVALGDNIYMRGYPTKDEGQEDWRKDQLESISFLDAQLKVAKESGAKLFLVPGNHDWYASEVDGQAAHIARYAEINSVAVHFEPYEDGAPSMAESEDLPGVSLVFLDSEWALTSRGKDREAILKTLDSQLARISEEKPDNLIVINAHHPLETYGPHGGHLAEFSYWMIMNTLYLFTDAAAEDTFGENYAGLIESINTILSKYDKVIYAAGHDHNLQVLRKPASGGPAYNIVSGAANSNKVSGVWHGNNTRFALSQEGFVELSVTADGTYLQVFDIHHEEPIAGFWLAL
jgi:hypothetical protein